jgi:hypothetical protein
MTGRAATPIRAQAGVAKPPTSPSTATRRACSSAGRDAYLTDLARTAAAPQAYSETTVPLEPEQGFEVPPEVVANNRA